MRGLQRLYGDLRALTGIFGGLLVFLLLLLIVWIVLEGRRKKERLLNQNKDEV